MAGLVGLQDVLQLRSQVLRDGRIPPEGCIWPEDLTPGGIHFGEQLRNEVICIASVYQIPLSGESGMGYQLRGMATAPGLSGKGLGSRVLESAIRYIQANGATYLWCNARTSATRFYRRHGFDIIGTEFDVPGVGPHFKMILRLVK